MTRWTVLLPLVVLTGCSTDASGLGGDVVLDGSIEDSTFAGDETKVLFDADDDAAVADTGTSVVDSAEPVDTFVVDTEVPDTAMPDTGVDSTPPIDTAAPDAVADTTDGSILVDAPESDGGLTPAPGRVVCNGSLCASGEVCCESSGGFKCTSSCGTFGGGGFKCDEKADCSGGMICCADVSLSGSWNGTYCNYAITCITAQVCMKNSDCSDGRLCTPSKPSGVPFTLGICK